MANILDPRLIDFSEYAEENHGETIREAIEWLDEMVEDVGKPLADPGLAMTWDYFDGRFKLREDEVTLWAGMNGHGKSLVTGMLSADLVCRRQRVCVASMEMKPKKTLDRMIRQFTAGDPKEALYLGPDAVELYKNLILDFRTQSHQHLWIYDQLGVVDPKTMIGVARYCAKELGIQHFFLDNLMKCIKGADDYNAQKDFVAELFSIARDHKMHIHIVHHIKKLENELKIPDKMDVKGAGEITDIVDNVMIVWRNKDEKKKEDDWDAVLNLCKQRNGDGFEGKCGLYYDPVSQQFTRQRGQLINFFERCL